MKHNCIEPIRRLALGVSFLVCSSILCEAQVGLPPCPGFAPGGEPYFIFVDPIEWTGAPKDVNTSIQSKIRFAVQTEIERLNTELGDLNFSDGQPIPPLVSVMCSGRVPPDESAFDNNEFKTLSDNKVLLEIWGSIDDSATGEGSLSFVLIPAREYTKPAIYTVEMKVGPASQAERAMPEFLRTTKRLSAYAEMVLGIRLYENKIYAQSITHMCRGIGQLERSLKKAPVGAPKSARDHRLMQDVTRIVNNAIEDQRRSDSVAAMASEAPTGCPTGGN